MMRPGTLAAALLRAQNFHENTLNNSEFGDGRLVQHRVLRLSAVFLAAMQSNAFVISLRVVSRRGPNSQKSFVFGVVQQFGESEAASSRSPRSFGGSPKVGPGHPPFFLKVVGWVWQNGQRTR